VHGQLPSCESSRAGGHTGRFIRTAKERYRLSFFDEVDEPTRAKPRTPPRSAPRSTPRRRGSSGGRRPPGSQQSIQVRRGIALGALLVVILLIALGVHSCQVSATNSALQSYTNNVSSLIRQSNSNSQQLFSTLSTATGSSSAISVQNAIDQTLHNATGVLNSAKNMSVPSQVNNANQKLLLALQMRVDGISNIASEIQPALSTSATSSSIDALAAQMAHFYASDVLYKSYASPEIYSAMNSAGIRFSGLDPGQFLPDVSWLLPSYIASVLHVTIPGVAPAKIAPGLHGHQLNSVSVAGTTLQTGSTNTIPAKPAPSFTLNFANTGTNNETDVICKVTVTGTSVSGQTVVPETVAGKNATCQVKLTSTPPAGTHTVVATVEKVPGERNLSNNSLSFPVTFQ
jgi:hypothetical protein